jgi:SAM-dependent methyltransferase
VRTVGPHRYDVAPYSGAPDPTAHVARLESIASLSGMTPAAPETARVLELGCGDGANLLPLALDFPLARIVGCDLAAPAIARAQSMADALGAANLDLRHANVADVDTGWGQFDYVLCHDVFSWVAPDVRRAILGIYARNLTPHGVGYLSYDVLPGWRLHDVARDMARFHTRGLDQPRETIDQARAMLAMAAQVQDQDRGAYAALIRDEYCLLSALPDDQLYHLLSEEHHQAFYFHEFLGELDAAGLQWLGDADEGMRGPGPSGAAAAFLDRLSRCDRQQYADFLSNRTFRRALVCRAGVDLHASPDGQVLRRMWVGLATDAWLEPTTIATEIRLRTEYAELLTVDAAIADALRQLDRERPALVPFSRLCGDRGDDALVAFMRDAIGAGAIEGVLTPFRVTSHVGDCPMVSPLVRLQARDGSLVTNQKCEPLQLSSRMRGVVRMLDGAHDRAALAAAIARESELPDREPRLVIGDDMTEPLALAGECVQYARDRALLIA